MRTICLSAGHSAQCLGAVGLIDEFTENCNVVNRVTSIYRALGGTCYSFIDLASTSQEQNLETICSWHNRMSRDLDVSIHFNSSEDQTSKAIGTEVWYITQEDLAEDISLNISSASGLIHRGAKLTDDLYFLNHTEKPAVLIEVCFVNSEADVGLYRKHFSDICKAIARTLSGVADNEIARGPLLDVTGKASWFGGPDDEGVAPDEGLAFIQQTSDRPEVFLSYQPYGTTGLARRLDPDTYYVACRWDYDVTPKEMLLHEIARVETTDGAYGAQAYPADWGPNQNTGRVADLSPALLNDLGLTTDDTVRVVFPAPRNKPDRLPSRPITELPQVEISLTVPATVRLKLTVNGDELVIDE